MTTREQVAQAAAEFCASPEDDAKLAALFHAIMQTPLPSSMFTSGDVSLACFQWPKELGSVELAFESKLVSSAAK